ncbi:MAG: hydrogenase iron-sulfur subunit [Candidatus Heimdallarchaeota archaeon]|nr:hydrogenase iron-sulfur subunit [Candidatus Heimdallarchaeota archaeon]MCG3257098.1 hydrogenase iron-sulfur subunit [Candidatus Heimdallarchaeota archaeon]MCK4612158.1 hydrogenase iron-sulfur subunit [Candidatus Heimdallarchaeota archaeon]
MSTKKNTELEEFEPNIIGFLCNWCSYAGADLAGTSRIQYPPNVKIIKVMCSGRVNPMYIINAFQQGADGVLVSGCHPGDCHYTSGNYLARRRIATMKKLLEFLGIEPDRVRMTWVSAAEGRKYADVVRELTDDIKKLGPMTKFRREKEW